MNHQESRDAVSKSIFSSSFYDRTKDDDNKDDVDEKEEREWNPKAEMKETRKRN
jgi:hypothetical protein